MNILEEIQNCPVEWKELGEVTHSIKTGLNPRKFFQLNSSDASNYYITVREIRGHKIVPSEKTDLINNDGLMLCQNRSNLEIGDVLFTGTGTIGNVAIIEKTPTNWNIKEGVYAIKPKKEQICSKFLMYLFESENIKKEIERRKAGGTVKSVSMAEMKKIKIPIPPLEIQEKIVQILDKMTEYVTELTSELTSRKKQYSFYRDKLLSFEDEVYQVEWKKLSECLKKGKGTKITASQMKLLHKDGAPIRIFAGGKTYADVNYGDIPDKDIHTEEAIVVKSRGIIDFEYCTKPFSFKNEFWSYSSDNENINLRYIYHYLVHNKEHFQNIANNMQMPQISSNDTEKFKIPVPSLEIQSRIVQVLDNFDMVCNDLNIGLPKEIELRQKQYEYFREKLLTFVAEGEYTESRVEEWDNSAIIKLLQWVFGPIRVELGAICDFVRGNGLQKKDFTAIGKSVIHYGQIYTKYDFSVSETLSKTSEIVFEKLKKAQSNDLVMATTSENVEDVGKAIVWEGKEEIGISGDSYIIQTTQNSRYLNYWLRSTSFQTQKERKVTGTKVIRINSKDIEKFQIILPSLIEQERIVSILDKFNILTHSLSEGLPKEIELRQKQYEYWRNQLLNFNE
ncbi:restriction endonuclease subunit S [Streptococcus oralis]|uniref:restriction endonuclease subunit S n=1 Tax=Streptococcus oralis TaxID=1303 RepID=UPI003F63FDF0